MAESVKQVSLTGVPRGMQTSLTQAQRRRIIADELMKQSLAPKDRWTIDTGKYLVPDIGAGLGKIGQALMGRQFADESDKDIQGLLNQAEQQRQQQTAQYLQTKFGGQYQGSAPPEGQVGPPTMEQSVSKPDPYGAIARALMSDDPNLQAMGSKDMEKMPNPEMILKAAGTGKISSEGLQAFTANPGNPGALTPQGQFHNVEGMGVTTVGGRPVEQAPILKFGDVKTDPVTGIPMQTELGTGRSKGLAGGNLHQDGQKGIDEMDVQSAKLLVGELGKSKENLLRLKTNLPNLEQLPDLIRKASTGAGADLKNLARRWGAAIGIPVDESKIDSYQTLKRELFMPYIEKLRMQGSGQSMSDKDAMRAIEGALADPTFNEDAMIRAVGAQIAGVMNATATHGQLLDSYGQMPGTKKYIDSKAFYVDMPVFTPEYMQKFNITGEPGQFTSSLTAPVPGGKVSPTGTTYTPQQLETRRRLGLQ